MKLMIRMMGLMYIGIYFLMMVLELVSLNVYENELNTITQMAITSTQIVMQENIEDNIYGTNNARKVINSDEEYFDLYVTNFNKLITTNGEYTINLLAIDYTKGLIDVETNLTYQRIIGKSKTLSTRKTSLVDVLVN